MPHRGIYNVSPGVAAQARAAQGGIPQSGVTPQGADIQSLIAALAGGGQISPQVLMQLLAMLAGAGQGPMMQGGGEMSPIEEAYMMGGQGGET